MYIIQIDIALLSGIFSELASIPTIYILLKDKVFEEDVKSEELKEELISTI